MQWDVLESAWPVLLQTRASSSTSSPPDAHSMTTRRTTGMVTIKDVAAQAGVSTMTVSRAIRSPDLVAPGTRAAVQAAIDALSYIPDLGAGSLSSKKSRTVGVILPSLHFEGHARTIDSLSLTLRKHGLHLLIADNFYSRTDEMELLRALLGRRPAGIVMINSAHTAQGRDLLLHSGVPVVETWSIPSEPMDSVVGFEHAEVGRALAEHLIDQGRRRIAFVCGPPDSDPSGTERRKGFEAAMRDHDCGAPRLVTMNDEHLTIAAGKLGIERLLTDYPDTDAAAFLTDRVAMGAMMECRRRGIRVPEDLAITGHGGFDFSEYLVPSLTTTRIDARAIGIRTAELLINRIEGHDIPASELKIDVGFELVLRDSSVVSH